jgi:hypothetical protein
LVIIPSSKEEAAEAEKTDLSEWKVYTEISDTVDVTLDSDVSQKWLAVRIME